MSDEVHTLYRFFDADGELLYVGITCDPGSRFKQHRRGKSWWHEIARIELEQFSSRVELEQAEREAIPKENPKYNINLRRGGTPAPPPGYRPDQAKGLVGLYFYSDGDEGWQGKVVGSVGGRDMILIVRLYSWITGERNGTKMVPANDMLGWNFFETREEWVAEGDRICGNLRKAQAEREQEALWR